MLDRICIAVDGSDCARRAAAVGLAIADAADAAIDVVHADRPGDDPGSQDAEAVLADLDDLLADASVPVERHGVEGAPAASIVACAEERDADLLVLGRRGHGGVGDRLLGSVVHAVLRRSDRPVLAVPQGEGDFDVETVFLPSDGSEAAERAAPLATAIAGDYGARIHACNALDLATAAGPYSAGGVTRETIERYEAERQTVLDRLAERIRETDPGLTVDTEVRRDAPHVAIRDCAREVDADLIVMGSTGQTSAVGQLLGSTADRVLRTVDVPVLVVPGNRR
jgi:nucleotide-binding universal stress UspA family protein